MMITRFQFRGLTLGAVLISVFALQHPRAACAETRAPMIAAQSAEAESLADIDAVKKLQRAYGYYVDRGFWNEAVDLFAAQASFESGRDGVVVGQSRIREYLIRQGGGNVGPGLPYGQYNHHMQLQPVVHIATDGRSARARWLELALVGQYKTSAEWGEGIYENSYVKDNGVWKIQSLHYFPRLFVPYAGGWASPPADAESSHTPPFHYGPSPVQRTTSPAATAEAARLALLRSRSDIENLQDMYGYYIDAGRWSEAASLFAPGATYEYGQRGVYAGTAHIKTALGLMGPEGLKPGQLNVYMMLQPVIDVAADNRTAQARWRSDVMLAQDGKAEWGEGTYENTYANVDGVWKIQSLHFYPTLFMDYEKGWVRGAIAMDGPSKALPPDRPPSEIFQSFPSTYLPPYHYAHPVTDAHPAAAPGPSDDPALDLLRRQILLLEDRAAVERLQRIYGYYVDKSQWPKVADLFASYGTLEIGGRGVFVGKAHVLAYLQGLGETGPQRGLVMNHQQFQGIVDIAADGKTARGRWTAFIMAGKSPDANWGDAIYENRYVKEGGVWKILALHAPFQMYSPVTEGWANTALPNTRPDSWAPPPDLRPTAIYNTYPSFYVEPYHYPNPVTGRPMPALNPAAGGIAPMKVAGVLNAAATATSSVQMGSDPRIGTWEEQRVSDDFDSLRRVIAPADGGRLRLIVNAKLLEVNRWHVDFSCDDTQYRILTQDGKFTGVTYSCRRTGPRNFQFSTTRTAADPGVTLAASSTRESIRSAGTEIVSEDGKRYSIAATLTFADGHQRLSRREFVRRE
jgi:hypothetical protein